jgi:hypothetical protein
MKSTTTITRDDPKHGTRTEKIESPAGDPSTEPPTLGGIDAPSWASDDEIRTGTNAADMYTGSDGTDNGYVDWPAVVPGKDSRPPAAFDAKLRVELRDCHGTLKETLEFEIHLAIDATGKATRDQITPGVHGTK